MGRIWIDAVTFDEALAAIEALVEAGRGGSVFTPNVNHIVMAESSAEFRQAYRRASLSLADGAPLLWASRLLGASLPEKLSGSDMVVPIVCLAAEHGWRVYLLGGPPGVAREASRVLRDTYALDVVGTDDSRISLVSDPNDWPVVERIRRARPDLIFVALGAPKQELWISRVMDVIQPAVAIGVGAGLNFITGHTRRAPRWMSRAGLEWAYRLHQDPRRLWRRYILENPRILGIVLATSLQARRRRVLDMQHEERPAAGAPKRFISAIQVPLHAHVVRRAALADVYAAEPFAADVQAPSPWGAARNGQRSADSAMSRKWFISSRDGLTIEPHQPPEPPVS